MSQISKNKQVHYLHLLIGAPNVGKSTIFNRLTTSVAVVSNIDRMTTEHTVGNMKHEKNTHLVDLPGVYNLSHPIAEEHEVNFHLIHQSITGIVNVIAAKSLERDLYLTIQSLETGYLSTLVINMIDTINVKAVKWDVLSKELGGLNVVLCQSNKDVNVDKIVDSIHKNKTINDKVVTYPQEIENYISKIIKVLPNCFVSKRFHAIMLLEGNDYFHNYYKTNHSKIYKKICNIFDCKKCPAYAIKIRDCKWQFVHKVLQKCGYDNKTLFVGHQATLNNKFDKYFFKGWIGFPLFLLIIGIIYYLAFGPYAGGWLQGQFGDWLSNIVSNVWLHNLLANQWHAPDWCCSLVIDGVFGGFFTVLPFLVCIVILYICFSILQQTGFLARASILFDKLLWHFGISGRSIVTLITGFGCTVPAILLVKSSSSRKERIIATLVAPFCACTTRVVVIAAICSACFAKWSWVVTLSFIFGSGIIALFIGLCFSKTLFRRENSFFCVEMVQWTKLDLKVIAKTTWLKVKEFLKKAALIIVACNLLVWVLLHIGPTGFVTEEEIRTSFLYYISYGISYIHYPFLGVCGHDGWQYNACLIASLPAKEVALGTINNIIPGAEGAKAIAALFNFIENGNNTLACLRTISFLTYFTLYIPCIPSIITMRSSIGGKKTTLSVISSLLFALVLASMVYWTGFGIIQLM